MNTSATIVVNRNDLVPVKGRAEWLIEHGTPADKTEINITQDVRLWEAAGVELRSDGIPMFVNSRSRSVNAALVDDAIRVMRDGGIYSDAHATTLLQRLANELSQEKADRAKAEQEEERESETFLQYWLEQLDQEMIEIWRSANKYYFGVKDHWNNKEGEWSRSGTPVLRSKASDPRYVKRRNQRVNLATIERDRQQKEYDENRAGAIDELVTWAMDKSDRINDGVAREYDMRSAIGELLSSVFVENLVPKGAEVVVESSPRWNDMELEERKSPSSKALDVVREFEQTVMACTENDNENAALLPSCVTFDAPTVERVRVKVEDDYGEHDVVTFTAVVVTMSAPSLPDRWILTRVENS